MRVATFHVLSDRFCHTCTTGFVISTVSIAAAGFPSGRDATIFQGLTKICISEPESTVRPCVSRMTGSWSRTLPDSETSMALKVREPFILSFTVLVTVSESFCINAGLSIHREKNAAKRNTKTALKTSHFFRTVVLHSCKKRRENRRITILSSLYISYSLKSRNRW
jgi:hypothetical protein